MYPTESSAGEDVPHFPSYLFLILEQSDGHEMPFKWPEREIPWSTFLLAFSLCENSAPAPPFFPSFWFISTQRYRYSVLTMEKVEKTFRELVYVCRKEERTSLDLKHATLAMCVCVKHVCPHVHEVGEFSSDSYGVFIEHFLSSRTQ
jgi:hypothetical protein